PVSLLAHKRQRPQRVTTIGESGSQSSRDERGNYGSTSSSRRVLAMRNDRLFRGGYGPAIDANTRPKGTDDRIANRLEVTQGIVARLSLSSLLRGCTGTRGVVNWSGVGYGFREPRDAVAVGLKLLLRSSDGHRF